MEVVVVGVILIVGFYLFANAKAKKVVRTHAATLSQITGEPARRIEREMIQYQLTPGQWASRNGLDPMTFQPLGGPTENDSDERARAVWDRVRWDEEAPFPSTDALAQIGDLQSEFAMLRSRVPLLAEMERQREVLVHLYELGSRVDGEFVARKLGEWGTEGDAPMSGPRTQDEYDKWQRMLAQDQD